jgi:hypothetical protein
VGAVDVHAEVDSVVVFTHMPALLPRFPEAQSQFRIH